MSGLFCINKSKQHKEFQINMRNVTLVLENGLKFQGKSFGFESPVTGEVVFNSAMTGYPEALTDPTFKGQIMVMTYPIIGNYGVPPIEEEVDGIAYFTESNKIQPAAVIMSDYSEAYSHWNAKESLGDWLKREKVTAITGVDTRELTKALRENGVMMGKVVFNNDDEIEIDYHYDTINYVQEVSCQEILHYNSGAEKKVVMVDCGAKNNTIRSLVRRGVEIIRVPWNFNFNEMEFDGLFISSGPGNPTNCKETIENIKQFLASENIRPCMGVGMGNLLLAEAAGAKTYKLKYGHRTHNQPVRLVGSNKCFITTQTHGYAVDANSLPNDWQQLFVNMNDGSNEGIRHNKNPWFAVQFQPEPCNNPVANDALLDEFITLL